MRYFVRPVLAAASHTPSQIPEARFKELKTAKHALVTTVGIEEKFDILLANYADFERERLDLSVSEMLYSRTRYEDFHAERIAVTRRLVNLLAAASLFTQQARKDLVAIYGRKSEMVEGLNSTIEAEKAHSHSYRLMSGLRNHLLHFGVPITAQVGGSTDERGESQKLRHYADAALDMLRLRDDASFDRDKNVLDQLPRSKRFVPITQAVKEYMEGLGNVLESLRSAMAADIATWENAYLGAINEFDSGKKAVLIWAQDDSGRERDGEQVFTELTNHRTYLVHKNGRTTGLARRYVSGETT